MSLLSAWLGIAAIVMGTLLTRSLLPVLGARVQLTRRAAAALRFAPGCALAAIVVPELVMPHGELMLGLQNLKLPAAMAAVLISYYTRSTIGTIVGGMVALWILTWLL